MIYLFNSIVNEVPVIINSTYSVYSLKVRNEFNRSEYIYEYTNKSTNSYWSLFEIEISASASVTQSVVDGVVKMASGQWSYEVWSDILLEKGMLIVERSDIKQNVYI